MAQLLASFIIISVCVIVNVQGQLPTDKKLVIGQAFDEIVVSSDLNVRRKSKENRQDKKILMNVPSGTTGPGKPTEIAFRLVSSDGSRIKDTPNKRQRRTSNQWALEHWILESRN
ncbi:uncharacterized protein LOC103569283 [Microplitis demolitor]|uniref:uncharacterized protein LOC103569283 n=1 Tax=Microplitis demolitor TaxID=69319 RepID=UPI0004CD1708|nr:uncharacterized protein LOC103569283 [Microplitis demolitor]